jgi:hypothetical protein
MRKRRKVYSEDDRFLRFDGTVTLRDTTDAALEAFALPEYREWERMWEEGRITGRECMERQTRLMNACPEMLRSLCNRIPIDDGIYDLESECIRSGSLLVIVSDGIDLLMEEVLTTRGLKHLPHYSNRLDWDVGAIPNPGRSSNEPRKYLIDHPLSRFCQEPTTRLLPKKRYCS